MRTLQVITAIRVIEKIYDNETKDAIFGGGLISAAQSNESDFLQRFITATHELARASAVLQQNSDVIKVLKAFDLEPLIDRDFITNLALSASQGTGSDKLISLLQMVVDPWRAMTGCTSALDSLTIPDDLRRAQAEKNVISIELHYKEYHYPTLTETIKVVDLLNQLYQVVAAIYGKANQADLTLVKIDSGSSIRFDCKGIKELIQPIKAFMIEAWNELRHKGIDKLLGDNKAMLSSLPIMDQLAKREQDKSIDIEKAEQLRRKILGTTLGLFAQGARMSNTAPCRPQNPV